MQKWLFGDLKKLLQIEINLHPLKLMVNHLIDILIKLTDGATGNINLNYIQNPPKRIFELTFTKGYIEFDYYKNSLSLFQKGKLVKKYINKKFDKNKILIKEKKYFLNKVKKNNFDLDMINSSGKLLKIILK